MKSLSQLKQTLQEVSKLDEIALATAASAYKKRIERGQLKKAIKTGEHVERKIKQELKEEHAWSLPNVLVLQRRTIRNFSDGTKVALYYNQRLDKYFSIPIRDDEQGHQDPIVVSESAVLDQLYVISEGIEESLILRDNSQVSVTPSDAEAILRVFISLNDTNKAAFASHLSESEDKFQKILNFSLEQI